MLESFDNFLFDADGVLWLGNSPIPGAIDFLNMLVSVGKNVYLISNNSSKSLEEYVVKLKKLGFTMIQRDNIYTPAIVAADYIAKNRKNSDLPVYLIGTKGLSQSLKDAGVESFGVGSDHFNNYTKNEFLDEVPLESKVSAVLCSYDNHFNYVKMMKAANYLLDEDVLFVITNEDKTFPGPKPGILIPGSGSISAAVTACAPRAPLVIGKPHKHIMDYMKERVHLQSDRAIMFGDRLDTDIAFGHNNGIKTCLVQTGIHSLIDVANLPPTCPNTPNLTPHFTTLSFVELMASSSS